jgi:hypothetical protein
MGCGLGDDRNQDAKSADAPHQEARIPLGLFDHVKNGSVTQKQAREGGSVRGKATLLVRLKSTGLFSKLNDAGKPLPGKARYKVIFEILGFDQDARLGFNPDYKDAKGWRTARVGDDPQIFEMEENEYFGKSSVPRLIGAAVAVGAFNFNEGTVSTLDGDTSDEALSKALDAFYADAGAFKNSWCILNVQTSVKRKKDKNGDFSETVEAFEARVAADDGFSTLSASPLDTDLLQTILQTASGATDEDAFNAWMAEKKIESEADALAFLRGVTDKDEIKRLVAGAGFCLAQQP